MKREPKREAPKAAAAADGKAPEVKGRLAPETRPLSTAGDARLPSPCVKCWADAKQLAAEERKAAADKKKALAAAKKAIAVRGKVRFWVLSSRDC